MHSTYTESFTARNGHAGTPGTRPFPRAEKRAEALAAACFEGGLVTYPSAGAATGTDGDVVMLAPPFVVTEPQLAEMVDVLDRSLYALGL